MRLKITKSKNATSIYIDGKNTSKIVEKLGTYTDIQKKLNGAYPIEWAKKYIEKLNQKEKDDRQKYWLNIQLQN